MKVARPDQARGRHPCRRWARVSEIHTVAAGFSLRPPPYGGNLRTQAKATQAKACDYRLHSSRASCELSGLTDGRSPELGLETVGATAGQGRRPAPNRRTNTRLR